MLVLTRREDQSILIGEDIKITIVKFGYKDGQVKVSIEAPKDVLILREGLKENGE
ncbi:carbon storage regulator [bacterium SCSIO 12696]|nr:carbon storage regulator [bacterium SCSIO 12696]